MKKNIIEDLINLIMNSYCDEDDSIFWGSLTVLKKYTDFDSINRDSMRKLVNMVPVVKDIATRAYLIEIIAEFLCFQYDNNEKLIYDNNEELLDEYVYFLSQDTTDIKDAESCLSAFIILGINKDEVFNKIARKLERKKVIQILMSIEYEWENVPKELEEIYKEVEIGKRISYRSNLISTFLLIIHPLCFKYEHINCVSSSYPSLLSAIADWGWKTPGSTNYIVKRKIVTKKEGEILEHLGELLMNGVEWDSEEIRKLYDEFFDDKNPFDVMFTLPE